MIKGTTASGFDFEIEESALDNWELLEALVDIDDGHIGGAVHALKMLLGEKQFKALKEHCRDKTTNKIAQKDMFDELSEILSPKEKTDEKNS